MVDWLRCILKHSRERNTKFSNFNCKLSITELFDMLIRMGCFISILSRPIFFPIHAWYAFLASRDNLSQIATDSNMLLPQPFLLYRDVLVAGSIRRKYNVSHFWQCFVLFRLVTNELSWVTICLFIADLFRTIWFLKIYQSFFYINSNSKVSQIANTLEEVFLYVIFSSKSSHYNKWEEGNSFLLP